MVLSLKLNSPIFLWFGFVASLLLTRIVDTYLWNLSSYFTILSVLGAIQFVLGLWLLKAFRFAWRTVILVVTGILVGQWWAIEGGFALLCWSINGFGG